MSFGVVFVFVIVGETSRDITSTRDDDDDDDEHDDDDVARDGSANVVATSVDEREGRPFSRARGIAGENLSLIHI